MDHDTAPSDDPLDDIIRELLFERTEDLEPPRLAAYIDGWGSAMRLLAHTSILLPGAPDELLEAFSAVLSRIRDAQERVLED